ncbi:GTP cyclohydrolase II RibA [Pseudoalteromonas fenneropenaei]|uniref:GTP cyclohydrolase II n=1 Tax=Pseudoalteromonas fenneropenaei TaxID=1737459 RepID=A0ABV7CHX0_9GAMM
MKFKASTVLPTALGQFVVEIYQNHKGEEITAICHGDIAGRSKLPVRMHSACFTAEVLGSLKCDCKQQLDYALGYIAANDGMVIYLPQEGRGIGLTNKIRAYALQELGYDTIEANAKLNLPIDARTYDDAAEILAFHGIRSVQLLTNNPLKLNSLEALGIKVAGRIPVPCDPTAHSLQYLHTKRDAMGHLLSGFSAPPEEGVSPLQRPFIHVNFALSTDGQMSQANGEPLCLSCQRDWQRVHELRERYDAVAVGAKTWLNDKPKLNVRYDKLGRKPLKQPHRVIFSGRHQAVLKQTTLDPAAAERETWLVTELSERPCWPSQVVAAKGWSLAPSLAQLKAEGIESMLVEGGLTLIQSFMAQQVVDVLTIYVNTASVVAAIAAATEVLGDIPADQITANAFGAGMLLTVTLTHSAEQPLMAEVMHG